MTILDGQRAQEIRAGLRIDARGFLWHIRQKTKESSCVYLYLSIHPIWSSPILFGIREDLSGVSIWYILYVDYGPLRWSAASGAHCPCSDQCDVWRRGPGRETFRRWFFTGENELLNRVFFWNSTIFRGTQNLGGGGFKSEFFFHSIVWQPFWSCFMRMTSKRWDFNQHARRYPTCLSHEVPHEYENTWPWKMNRKKTVWWWPWLEFLRPQNWMVHFYRPRLELIEAVPGLASHLAQGYKKWHQGNSNRIFYHHICHTRPWESR